MDRLAPATRGPDSFNIVFVVAVAVTGAVATSIGADGTDEMVVSGVAIGGTTATTFGCSDVTMTGFGCGTSKRNTKERFGQWL